MADQAKNSDADAKPPVFQNRSEGITLWAEKDKNGNEFLRLNLPMGLGSVPVFVNESGFKAVRDEFNDFVENLQKQG